MKACNCNLIYLLFGALAGQLLLTTNTEQSAIANVELKGESDTDSVEGVGEENGNQNPNPSPGSPVDDPKHPGLITDVPYEDCGSEFASLFHLAVYPKCGTNNCTLIRGEQSILTAHFMPRLNSSSLRVRVDRIDPIFGFSTILIPEFKACGERFNVSCPIVANEPQFASVNATFPRSIPSMKIHIKTIIMTDDSDVYFCLQNHVILA